MSNIIKDLEEEVDMAHLGDYICNVKNKYKKKDNVTPIKIDKPDENPYISEIRKEIKDDKT